MTQKTNGFVLHEDSERVVIVTGTARKSANVKTGDMLQVWILPVELSPLTAKRTNQDSVICGNCPHAGKDGACYVDVAKAPEGVWKAWRRGAYPFLSRANYPTVFTGRMVRWGAYGDPAYIPRNVLYWGSFHAAGWTGYTHQWRGNSWLMDYVMASVDSQGEALEATAAGWRYFRVRAKGASAVQGEIICPASPEGGNKTQCADCGLCNGARYTVDGRKSIVIEVHGVMAGKFIQIGGVN